MPPGWTVGAHESRSWRCQYGRPCSRRHEAGTLQAHHADSSLERRGQGLDAVTTTSTYLDLLEPHLLQALSGGLDGMERCNESMRGTTSRHSYGTRDTGDIRVGEALTKERKSSAALRDGLVAMGGRLRLGVGAEGSEGGRWLPQRRVQAAGASGAQRLGGARPQAGRPKQRPPKQRRDVTRRAPRAPRPRPHLPALLPCPARRCPSTRPPLCARSSSPCAPRRSLPWPPAAVAPPLCARPLGARQPHNKSPRPPRPLRPPHHHPPPPSGHAHRACIVASTVSAACTPRLPSVRPAGPASQGAVGLGVAFPRLNVTVRFTSPCATARPSESRALPTACLPRRRSTPPPQSRLPPSRHTSQQPAPAGNCKQRTSHHGARGHG